MEKIKYINDNEDNGIEVDWKKVIKKIEKLDLIPKRYRNPLKSKNFKNARLHISMSTRSTGKTTNDIIIGLVLYEMYGIETIYLRHMDESIRPKSTKQLFKTILNLGYLSKIFDGRWNNIYQYSRYFYLCNSDENGKIIEKDINPFMTAFACNESETVKSSYNSSRADWIIFDEYIESRIERRFQNDFFEFNDLLKTIIRDRISAHVMLDSNTIDVNASYLFELEIQEIVEFMKIGENELIRTEKGTPIEVELIEVSEELKKVKKENNRWYFGYKNSKMASITGEELWSFSNYPHVSEEGFEPYIQNIYLLFNDTKYLHCVYGKDLGRNKCVFFIHKTKTTPKKDAIVLTNTVPKEVREYNINEDLKIIKKIKKYNKEKRIIFASNTEGAMFEKFIK